MFASNYRSHEHYLGADIQWKERRLPKQRDSGKKVAELEAWSFNELPFQAKNRDILRVRGWVNCSRARQIHDFVMSGLPKIGEKTNISIFFK